MSIYPLPKMSPDLALGAGEDAPPPHPLLEAAANSSDLTWRNSFFAGVDYEGSTEVEDLSD